MLREHAPFGPYEIRQRLGAGAMGDVFLAFDTRLQRLVAIKVLRADATASSGDRDRILHEARAAAALRHPNVCTVFEAGEVDGHPFIAMEHIQGRSLAALVAAGPLAVDDVLRIGAQIADGLSAAHAQGLVHRDLKAANILIDDRGRASILDFGIAVQTANPDVATITRAAGADAELAGTPAYMAPEVVRGGRADPRADVWSLGIVLYEMVAGRRPFASDQPYALASSILEQSVPPLSPAVPHGLRAVIDRCLAKNVGERYQTASEVRAALDAIRADGGEPRRHVRHGRSRSRSRATLFAAIAMAIAVIGAGIALTFRRSASGAAPPRQVRAIAVLPLANLSGDSAQDFFADGMTEALITNLAHVKGVDVISRTSVMQYKATSKPVKEIARALGVDVVVEGSVIRAGDRVRVTAQLIDGSSDRHLWANDYDRDIRDVLALQRDVARAITAEIRAALEPAGASPPQISPEAHERYLKARTLIARFNEADIAAAIGLLEEAVRIQPDFADGWASLASAHAERGIWGRVGSRETASRAREAITRALALDTDNAEAYSILGQILTVYDWDLVGAEKAFRRSLELAPGDAHAHQLYASTLQAGRRFDDAVVQAEIGHRLDPVSTTSASGLARALYRARRFGEAIDSFNASIASDPTYGPNYARLADVYIALGRYDEAIGTLDRGQQLIPGSRRQTDGYGVAFALSGRRREAEAVVRELTERDRTSDQMAYSIAMVETALGHHDEAIAWLNRSYERRSANLFLVNADLKFDAIRSDPRFQNLIKRMNFTGSGRTASRTDP